jgi:hypothetical protein
VPDDRTPPSRKSSPRGGDVLFNLFSSALADRFNPFGFSIIVEGQ